jgi:Holliday junction resolvase RusA-like endonuclease
MSPVHFTVPGQPQGKGRPRIGRVAGHARMFTPEKTANYESMVALFAHQAMQGRPLLAGPVAVALELVQAIPASWSKVKRVRAENGEIFPTTKPDIDNTTKAIFDAINGVVWVDDVQVVSLTARKSYGAAPRVCVVVNPMEVQP